jgi:heat shock protein 5
LITYIDVGIELGDDYCRAGIMANKTFYLILDEHGNTAMPSYVTITENEMLFGFAAKQQAASNPKNTIYGFRRGFLRH